MLLHVYRWTIEAHTTNTNVQFWNETHGRFRSLLNEVTFKIPFRKPNFLSSRNNEMCMNQSTLSCSIRTLRYIYVHSTYVHARNITTFKKITYTYTILHKTCYQNYQITNIISKIIRIAKFLINFELVKNGYFSIFPQ